MAKHQAPFPYRIPFASFPLSLSLSLSLRLGQSVRRNCVLFLFWLVHSRIGERSASSSPHLKCLTTTLPVTISHNYKKTVLLSDFHFHFSHFFPFASWWRLWKRRCCEGKVKSLAYLGNVLDREGALGHYTDPSRSILPFHTHTRVRVKWSSACALGVLSYNKGRLVSN